MCNSECWYKEVCSHYADKCQLNCVQYLEMSYLMEHSGIPISKRRPLALYPDKCDLGAFGRLAEIKDNIDDFVFNGKNLYITSYIVGNGKTTWSLKLLMKYFEKIWQGNGFEPRGVFVHVPTFLLKCKDFKTVDREFEDLKRQLLDIDLVVWDDIASTDLTGYDLSQMLVYIDARCLADKANIFTGNIASRDLMEQALGTKLTSRIWNNSTEVVELKGGERR